MNERQAAMLVDTIEHVSNNALEGMAMASVLAEAIARSIPGAQPALQMHLTNMLNILRTGNADKPLVDGAEKLLQAVKRGADSPNPYFR